MFYVYILRSLSNNTYYTGSTSNLEKRLIEHNSGRRGYTSGRGPWELMHKEEFASRAEAMKREKHLKTGLGRKELKKILSQAIQGGLSA